MSKDELCRRHRRSPAHQLGRGSLRQSHRQLCARARPQACADGPDPRRLCRPHLRSADLRGRDRQHRRRRSDGRSAPLRRYRHRELQLMSAGRRWSTKLRSRCHMSGGKLRVPVVYHMLHGLRGGGAAQHSHSPQAMLWNAAGMEIVLPSSPYDVKGLHAQRDQERQSDHLHQPCAADGYRGRRAGGGLHDPLWPRRHQAAGPRHHGHRDLLLWCTPRWQRPSVWRREGIERRSASIHAHSFRSTEDLILDSVGRTGRLVVVDEDQFELRHRFGTLRHRG